MRSAKPPFSNLLHRRNFLKLSSAGVALGSAPWLASCGGGGSGTPAPAPQGETHTYYFNLANAHAGADYSIVAGTRKFALVPATEAHRQAAVQQGLKVPPSSITHVAENVRLTSAGPQTCYVKGVHPAEPKRWHMHSMFTHIPQAARDAAKTKITACRAGGPSLHGRFVACGGDPTALPPQDASTDPTLCDEFMSMLQDYYQQAITMVTHHPEIGSFDATTLAYIQQNIVCNDATVLELAFTLQNQGAASTTGGWATLVPVTDPATNADMLDSSGEPVYHCLYTQTTLQALATAMQSVLPSIKNDPNLGADITNLSADTENDSLQGKNWAIRYGATAVTPPPSNVSAMKPMDAAVTQALTPTDIPTHAGFSFDLQSTSGRTVNFQVSNWYLRYLGIYARFLDAGGNPIPLADIGGTLPANTGLQPSNTYDAYIDLVNQELVILGIPVKMTKSTYSVTVPDSASAVMLLAGGLGSGTKKYPDTVKPGIVSTAVLDLAIPGVFLAMAAATGFGKYVKSFPAEALLGVAQVMIQLVGDSIIVGLYGDTSSFKNAIQGVTALLLKIVRNAMSEEIAGFSAAVQDAFLTWRVFLTGSLATGEAEGAVEDAIPFGIGLIIQAVMAIGTAASIVETSVETARSPWTYAATVVFTHDVTLTITPDPADVAGFPQVATGFEIIATCDNAAPRTSGRIAITNPGVSQLQYTFTGLPEGGNVTFTVSITSSNGWQCASGTTGSVANNLDAYSMGVKETLVPLTANTQYSHLRKTQMSNGVRVWDVTGTKPAQPAFNCDPGSTSLCNVVDITLSEPFGAIGYAWQSASPTVTSYANGASGQLYQFANLSFALGNPQDGYKSSGQGFPEPPPRIAYSRDSANNRGYYVDSLNGNRVRGVYLTKGAPPAFDQPGGNLAYGYFNFSSDAFLVMPNGKLISFNGANSMMEILVPSAAAVSDSAAPQATTVSGIGTRDGLMNTPVCAAVTAKSTILVLESGNNRIQAFDTSGNPVLLFSNGTAATMPLKARDGVTYEDLVVEQAGYIYVLLLDPAIPAYVLDIYTPDGAYLCTTTDIRAARFAIDLFRNMYTLNFETLQSASVVEPSISEWVPSTP
ncbi:MAG TPA: hypothetical protein VMZ74_15825 [Ramlibacter sp.]|nr:hypothetical protein [Ramlibacter sp.]